MLGMTTGFWGGWTAWVSTGVVPHWWVGFGMVMVGISAALTALYVRPVSVCVGPGRVWMRRRRIDVSRRIRWVAFLPSGETVLSFNLLYQFVIPGDVFFQRQLHALLAPYYSVRTMDGTGRSRPR
ncbi:hypothetical protein TPY_2059 [Sulfobacillus acidophilus TPY]|nr:hypothetical protein TPY_2059 [Sulfobacillus acidophilus TPY]